MDKKFYITSAIPYVNVKPHIGHALGFVQADAIARYHKLLGDEILMLSGGDENALKNVQAAETAGEPIQDFIDKNNNFFKDLTKKLNCNYDVWQKSSNQKTHFPSSQKLWEVKEKNYFFKLSKHQNQLVKLIKSNKFKISPVERKNDVLSFLKKPLQDISISRSNERAKNWSVPVPNDTTQRMYVWFDALNIYQSGIGFDWDDEKYKKWWPADLHVIGKGITRFHAVYWPAFLLSAGLSLSKELFIHGYFIVNE